MMTAMSNPAVLAEIARLESELGRIQRDLDALKRSVGVPSSRKTQAYTNPLAPVSEHPKDTATREMRTTSADEPLERPQPSVPRNSETVPTSNRSKSDRRASGGGRTGLTDFPPSANPTPAKRAANVDPGAGRYEYVGEGRSKPRR